MKRRLSVYRGNTIAKKNPWRSLPEKVSHKKVIYFKSAEFYYQLLVGEKNLLNTNKFWNINETLFLYSAYQHTNTPFKLEFQMIWLCNFAHICHSRFNVSSVKNRWLNKTSKWKMFYTVPLFHTFFIKKIWAPFNYTKTNWNHLHFVVSFSLL